MPDPKKNVAYTFDVALVDTANRPQFKANPTLATGDVKVSIDEGAFANLGTLPTVAPASGRNVKVVLAQAEMNGDRITVQFVDAAGAEWDEVLVTLYPQVTVLEDVSARIPTALVSGRMSSDAVAISGSTTAADNVEANITNLDDAISGVVADLAVVQADTNDIQTRLPAALVSGRMASDAIAISGSTTAADTVETLIPNLDVAVSSVGGGTIPTVEEIADEVETRTIAAVLTVGTVVNPVTVSPGANPPGIKKNSALDNFTFVMVNTAGAETPALTVTATRRLDNGVFSACANGVTEVGGGVYTINLAASDLNGEVVTLKFTAPNARPRILTILTEP